MAFRLIPKPWKNWMIFCTDTKVSVSKEGERESSSSLVDAV